MKKILATTLIALSIAQLSFASENTAGVSYNKNGAVDVNAHVPYDVQVPKAPENLKLTSINPASHLWQNQTPKQPTLNAKSYVLMDAKSGNVIAANNPNLRIAPASLTKLMLLDIVFSELKNGTIKLDQKMRVPTVAWATGGSRMFLKPGSKVSVENLLKGVIIASGTMLLLHLL